MKKPKRITPEQYLTLAALKMPVFSTNYPDLWRDIDLVEYMLNGRWTELEQEDCQYRVIERSAFYTLVDSNDET